MGQRTTRPNKADSLEKLESDLYNAEQRLATAEYRFARCDNVGTRESVYIRRTSVLYLTAKLAELVLRKEKRSGANPGRLATARDTLATARAAYDAMLATRGS